MVTFDHLGALNVETPGFGEAFLLKHGFDVLNFQKRKENYYQDLSRDCFKQVVHNLPNTYDRVCLYGSSLGGYAALYYSIAVESDLIAISPLCSIHPGHNNVQARHDSRVEWQHDQLQLPTNYHASAVILTDPYDHQDAFFLQGVVRPAFPEAYVVKVPFGGHPVGEVLSELGVLKQYIVDVLRREGSRSISTVGIKGRSKSIVFNMANEAIRRNKTNIAIALSDRLTSQYQDNVAFAIQSSRAMLNAGLLDSAFQKALDAIGRSEETGDLQHGAAPLAITDRAHAGHFVDLGKALTAAKRYSEASRAFATAIRLNDEVPWWRYLHASTLYEAKRYEEAIATLKHKGADAPHYAEAWNLLGRCHAISGNVTEATRAYSRAHELRPTWLWPLLQLANLQLGPGGDPEVGISALSSFISRESNINERQSLFRLKGKLHELIAERSLREARRCHELANAG
ncbi:tetratricopeptide repeat protein [Chthonobacter rhizosphaerae]|uniref:tetratricopeptide repeat protein n=1 Tax=Chthonobacter rhizosphaerae TaxID=2735553 RepID=UPI0015EE3EDC